MSPEFVEIRRADHVAIVAMNKPERRNALDDLLVDALDAALQELTNAQWCRALVLTGNGPSFCAGGDMTANSGADLPEAVARQRRFVEMAKRLFRLPKPTVSAVNGAAIGGGFSLALLCDEVVLHSEAKLNLGFLPIGLPPDLLSAVVVQRRAGWTVATDLLHSGRLLPADEAKRLNLANEVVSDDVVASAVARAERLAALSPVAFAATKALLRQAWSGDAEFADAEAMAVGLSLSTSEFQEATARFRRPPGAEAGG